MRVDNASEFDTILREAWYSARFQCRKENQIRTRRLATVAAVFTFILPVFLFLAACSGAPSLGGPTWFRQASQPERLDFYREACREDNLQSGQDRDLEECAMNRIQNMTNYLQRANDLRP